MTNTVTLNEAAQTLDRRQLWYAVGMAIDCLPDILDRAELENDPELLRTRLLAAAEMARVLWMLDRPAVAMRV